MRGVDVLPRDGAAYDLFVSYLEARGANAKQLRCDWMEGRRGLEGWPVLMTTQLAEPGLLFRRSAALGGVPQVIPRVVTPLGER